jgi:predicted Zn-dependent protease
MMRRIILFVLALSLFACETPLLQSSPLGRRQLRLFPASEMDAMGVAAYQQMKEEMPQSNDRAAIRLVTCVSKGVTDVVHGAGAPSSWEVTVFEDESANAFALPGGKIGVHTGLLKVATDQSQLAAVIGHEIAHVLAQHGNERASTTFVTQSGLQVIQSLSGPASAGRDQVLAGLGLGAQVGVLLPFSRAQEREADLMGLDLMAEAGFDPRASVTLWQNMARSAGAGAPPEMLSTHPSSSSRIRDLQERIPSALSTYERARAAGKRPACD